MDPYLSSLKFNCFYCTEEYRAQFTKTTSAFALYPDRALMTVTPLPEEEMGRPIQLAAAQVSLEELFRVEKCGEPTQLPRWLLWSQLLQLGTGHCPSSLNEWGLLMCY